MVIAGMRSAYPVSRFARVRGFGGVLDDAPGRELTAVLPLGEPPAELSAKDEHERKQQDHRGDSDELRELAGNAELSEEEDRPRRLGARQERRDRVLVER